MSATNPGGFIPERTEGDLVYRLNYQRFYKFEAFAPIGDPYPSSTRTSTLYILSYLYLSQISDSGRPRGGQVCRGTRCAGICAETSSSPSSTSPTAQASSIPTPTSYLACSLRKRAGHPPQVLRLSKTWPAMTGRNSCLVVAIVRISNPATKRFPYALAGQGAQPLGSRR